MNGTYDIVSISDRFLDEIPKQWATVEIRKRFDCSSNNIKYLTNSPKIVYGDFNCRSNQQLISLKESPEFIGGNFDCCFTSIKTLNSSTTEVGKVFDVFGTPITSLEGAPARLNILAIGDNKITSFKDIHKHLNYCKKIIIQNSTYTIESHIIGLLLVNGLKSLEYVDAANLKYIRAMDIVYKYIGLGKLGLLECSAELCDAGLEQYAQL